LAATTTPGTSSGAIECKQPYGHAAQPWTTWSILESLERATGHAVEALAARNRAMETYLAYRRAGGESHAQAAEFFTLVERAVRQGTQDDAMRMVTELAAGDLPPWASVLLRKLRAILTGARDPALAADLELSYLTAAELQYLLEKLGTVG
jgi:hypothetical protein